LLGIACTFFTSNVSKSTSKHFWHLGHLQDAFVLAGFLIINFPSWHHGHFASYGNSSEGIVAYNSFIILVFLAANVNV